MATLYTDHSELKSNPQYTPASSARTQPNDERVAELELALKKCEDERLALLHQCDALMSDLDGMRARFVKADELCQKLQQDIAAKEEAKHVPFACVEVTVSCPSCSTDLFVMSDDLGVFQFKTGAVVKCPKCGGEMRV